MLPKSIANECIMAERKYDHGEIIDSSTVPVLANDGGELENLGLGLGPSDKPRLIFSQKRVGFGYAICEIILSEKVFD